MLANSSDLERHRLWRNLKEDLQICFDRASDLLADKESDFTCHATLVCRLAERSVLKICDSMISGETSG